MEVIKLLVFTSAPLVPRAERSELAPGEAANGLFSRSDCLQLDGLHNHFHFFSGDGGLREVEVRMSNRGDRSNVGEGELVMMIGIGNIAGVHDVVLSNSAPSFSRRELLLNSKFQLKTLRPLIMKLT